MFLMLLRYRLRSGYDPALRTKMKGSLLATHGKPFVSCIKEQMKLIVDCS